MKVQSYSDGKSAVFSFSLVSVGVQLAVILNSTVEHSFSLFACTKKEIDQDEPRRQNRTHCFRYRDE